MPVPANLVLGGGEPCDGLLSIQGGSRSTPCCSMLQKPYCFFFNSICQVSLIAWICSTLPGVLWTWRPAQGSELLWSGVFWRSNRLVCKASCSYITWNWCCGCFQRRGNSTDDGHSEKSRSESCANLFSSCHHFYTIQAQRTTNRLLLKPD